EELLSAAFDVNPKRLFGQLGKPFVFVDSKLLELSSEIALDVKGHLILILCGQFRWRFLAHFGTADYQGDRLRTTGAEAKKCNERNASNNCRRLSKMLVPRRGLLHSVIRR